MQTAPLPLKHSVHTVKQGCRDDSLSVHRIQHNKTPSWGISETYTQQP